MCIGNLQYAFQIVGSVQYRVSYAKRKQSVRQLRSYRVVVLGKIINAREIERQPIPDHRSADVRVDCPFVEWRFIVSERIPGVQSIIFEYRHEVAVPRSRAAALEHFSLRATGRQAACSV